MANAYVQLPVDGVGKKLDSESLVVGADTVHRERDQIAGTAAAEIAAVKASDPALAEYGLVVRQINLVNPIRDYVSTVALAAGASANLDGTTIGSGKTGKLAGVNVGSSAACKWVVQSRDGAVLITFGVLYTSGLAGGKPSDLWLPPDKRFCTLAGAGVDENFRVTVTNLDQENAADASATLFWDEV